MAKALLELELFFGDAVAGRGAVQFGEVGAGLVGRGGIIGEW